MKITSRPSKQRGIAIIIFVLVYPVFFALFILSVESTRYLQEHARTGDVTEIAALAISAHESTVNLYEAQSYEDIYNIITDLITEEVGHHYNHHYDSE